MSEHDAAFEAAWSRFAACVAAWTPAGRAALRAPATAGQIADLETALGFALHPALKALLATHDGAEEILPAAFLPGAYRLATTEEIAEEYRTLGAYTDRKPDDQEAQQLRWWVPFALPWSEGMGMAFVDHRPGRTFGSVHEYGSGWDLTGPADWRADLAEFFDALADSVANGRPFHDLWPVPVESASGQPCLAWETRD